MKSLEVYIHIPFCAKKCSYCDFLSAPADGRTKRLYVEALQKEIRLSYYKFNEYVVDSVFIGGGTPSVLFGSQIEEILSTLRKYANMSENAKELREIDDSPTADSLPEETRSQVI